MAQNTEHNPLVCTECGGELNVGQPMRSRGRRHHVHVGCDVVAAIRSQYGADALRSRETLPPLEHAKAA